jgi:hypothetical protein
VSNRASPRIVANEPTPGNFSPIKILGIFAAA